MVMLSMVHSPFACQSYYKPFFSDYPVEFTAIFMLAAREYSIKGMAILTREEPLSEMILPPFSKWGYSTGKDFAPQYSIHEE